jgi:hypothetical protein
MGSMSAQKTKLVKKELDQPFVTVGKIYIDKDGGGRLYLKKKVMEILNFFNGEEVRVEVDPKENKIIITKL